MPVKFEHISVNKTARYYTLGELSDKTERIWVVLHGFGQLGGEFINNFNLFDDGKTLVIAPEALNRFYLKGFSGKIGATWMTKEDRQAEIDDYVNYLDSILLKVFEKSENRNAELNVLGFSQGTATACRWTVKSRMNINRLILWGGGIPPDADFSRLKSIFESGGLSIVIGDEDQFITEEILEAEIEKFRQLGINYKLTRFKGGHEINQEALKRFI